LDDLKIISEQKCFIKYTSKKKYKTENLTNIQITPPCMHGMEAGRPQRGWLLASRPCPGGESKLYGSRSLMRFFKYCFIFMDKKSTIKELRSLPIPFLRAEVWAG